MRQPLLYESLVFSRQLMKESVGLIYEGFSDEMAIEVVVPMSNGGDYNQSLKNF